MKLAFANSNYKDADIIFLGVPDESGNRSYRKGSSKAPYIIRKVSNERFVFKRDNKKYLAQPQTGFIKKKMHDYGDVNKKILNKEIERILNDDKKIIICGGDHSITTEILKGYNNVVKDLSVIYFDAHPDFICSNKKYYGSVICDINDYKNIKFKNSLEIGIREPEKEELINLRKSTLMTFTSLDILKLGVNKIFNKIRKRVTNKVYVSIDFDVLDPAFAPGVSTPVPGGLTSIQLIYLIKSIAKLNLIGLDITEINPNYDINNMTSHLAAKLILEILG